MYSMNIWPVIVASVVGMGIGALWYSPYVFGKEWVALSNISKNDLESARARGMWKQYVIQLIAYFVMFSVFGFLVSASGTQNVTDAAFLGVLVWLGFVVANSVGDLLWANKPLKLIMINAIGSLLALVVGGAILGIWL